MMDYQLKLRGGLIVRPTKLIWGGQIAIVLDDDGDEVAIPRSVVEEIIFDDESLNRTKPAPEFP